MIRVGLGVDVHAFGPARALVIGGVTIPHERGLVGHSDADVLSHAIVDSLLGAAGLGDIGRHFPTSDPRWEGCSSLEFLIEVRRMLAVAGWRPGNVDSVIIAQEPRMAPHLPAMHEAVAGARSGFCDACFTGAYPTAVPDNQHDELPLDIPIPAVVK